MTATQSAPSWSRNFRASSSYVFMTALLSDEKLARDAKARGRPLDELEASQAPEPTGKAADPNVIGPLASCRRPRSLPTSRRPFNFEVMPAQEQRGEPRLTADVGRSRLAVLLPEGVPVRAVRTPQAATLAAPDALLSQCRARRDVLFEGLELGALRGELARKGVLQGSASSGFCCLV
jgi:hypothetical protein